MSNPYENLPKRNYWSSAVGKAVDIYSDIYTPKFNITKDDKIMTAGSCFAQHIGSHLKKSGFNILDYEKYDSYYMSLEVAQKFGYGIYSGRYGNIYTVQQYLQLIKEALGIWRPSLEDLIWTKNGRFFDAFRPSIEPNGFSSEDELIKCREVHLSNVKRLISDSSLFIFTLGLTETWVNNENIAYPTAPGVIAGDFTGCNFKLFNFDTPEMIEQFEEILKILSAFKNDYFKFLLTVSPVPLTATAENRHVMVSTLSSKSKLRVVADYFYRKYPSVDYFPSYEIVINPWSKICSFNDNMRTVKSEAVDNVMEIFKKAHKIIVDQNDTDSIIGDNGDHNDVLCEEYLIETANLMHISS